MSLKDNDQFEEAFHKAVFELLQTNEAIREKYLSQFTPEERFRGLSLEDRVRDLSPEEREALKKLLH